MNGQTTVWAGWATAVWDYGCGDNPDRTIVPPSSANAARSLSRWAHDQIKRGLDVLGAAFGLALTLPLWAVIAMAIKCTSRGPVFFRQDRAGINGRPFRMIKFRTMGTDAEERLKDLIRIEDLAEPVYKIANDPRVTPVGRFLRRFGLDELPQLINVLRNEMSLVGPRPEVVSLAERYTEEQRRRLLVKPGITGWQQIHNRGMPDMAARLAYDVYYLRHRSVPLDIRILAMTVFVIASGREITY